MSIGDFAVRTKVVDATAMRLFGELVGDLNPLHHDIEAAQAAGFKAPIAYGMVAGSLFSEILGNELPGPGAVYGSQSFRFLAPIYVGDEVELRVEVIEVRKDQRVVKVRTTCALKDGSLCLDGEAVLIRRELGGKGE